MSEALSGVKVMELGQFVAAPFCSRLLADLGAEVVKIEEPRGGDLSRTLGPFPEDVPHQERSGLYLYLNSMKLGITLDVRTAEGQAIFKRLIADTDILIESQPPGCMESIGLGYDKLKELNPGLIMTSITPFGQTGPHRDYKAYYLNTFHAGGEGFLLPGGLGWLLYADRAPLKAGGYIGEYDSGAAAAVGTMAAFYWKGFSGEGQHVDISQQEALLSLSRVELTAFPNEGLIESRETRSWPVAGLVQCKDGFVQVMPLVEHMWKALAMAVGGKEMVEDERFQTPGGRNEHAEEINTRINEWALQRSKEEIYHRLQALGCPTGIVSTAEDLFVSEQLRHREYFRQIDHAEVGKLNYASLPYKFSETPFRFDRPAPRLGEHNETVYCGWLGYRRQDLARMRGMGVI